MKNLNIGITAEFTALIKSKKNCDYKFFVSKKTKLIYNIVRTLFPSKTIEHIFNNRIKLSNKFDYKVNNCQANAFIEIGCGYSLRGMNLCQKNPHIIYVDADTKNVIKRKKEALKNFFSYKKMQWPKNYYLLSIDVLKENIFKKITKITESTNNFLLIAEGLTPYFDFHKFNFFIKNISDFIENANTSIFFSHEKLKNPNIKSYKTIRLLVSMLSLSSSHHKFKNKDDLKNYIQEKIKLDIKTWEEDSQIFFELSKL